MAETPLRVPVEAFDPDLLAGSLAVMTRELVAGFTKAGKDATAAFSSAAQEGLKTTEQAAARVTQIEERHAAARQKATEQAAAAAAAATKKYADVAAKAIVTSQDVTQDAIKHTQEAAGDQERVWVRVGSKVIEVARGQEKAFRVVDSALRKSLTPAEKIRLEMDLLARAIAEVGDESGEGARAMAGLEKKLDSALKRETINNGRTLSELIDQQTSAILRSLGPWGSYADQVRQATSNIKDQVAGSDKFNTSAEAGNASLAAMVGIWGALAAAGIAGLGVVASITDEFNRQANEMDRVAFASGISTEQLSSYQTVAKRFNFDLVELADIHGNIAQKMVTAAKEVGAERDLFQALGITVVDVNGKTREVGDVFLELTDVIGDMRNNTEALNVAQAFLGEDGAKKLLYALRQQPGAFREAQAEARALNLVLNEDQVEAARNAKFATDSLSLAWQGFKNTLVNSGVGEFFEDLKLETAAVLGDGIVIGVERFSDGTERVIEANRMVGESFREFGDRVRLWRKMLEDNRKALAEQAAATEEQAGANQDLATTLREAEERRKKEAEAAREAAAAAKAHAAELERMRQILDVIAKDATPAHVRAMQEQEDRLNRLNEAFRAGAISPAEYATALGQVNAELLRLRVSQEEVNKGLEAGLDVFKTLAQEELATFSDLKAQEDEIPQALHDSEMARIEETKRARMDLANAIIGTTELIAAAAVRFGKDAAKAERVAFRAKQLGAAAAVVMNTAEGISQAMTLPPPADLIKAVSVGVVGATQGALIAMQKPPQVAHAGGIVGMGSSGPGYAPDEVNMRLKRGEVVTSASDARSVGGPAAMQGLIRSFVNGQGNQRPVVVVDRMAIARTLENDYLAGGRTRKLIAGRERYGLRPAGR